MKAVVTNGNMDIRLTDIPIPEVGEEDVLVRVKAVGICGSDIPRVLKKVCPVYPTVLGHEFCGVIEKVGKSVDRVKVSDKVAGIPLIPCFECSLCKAGNYGQCKSFKFIGTKVNGAMAEYVVVNQKNVYRLSDETSYLQGAFFEPLTVALHALLNMEYNSEGSTAIVGSGTIGLLALQCINIMGAAKKIAIDINESKLKKANKFGADICINPLKEDVNSIIRENTDMIGVEQILECAGVAPAIKLSLSIASVKAKIMLVGLPHTDVTLNPVEFDHISRKELTLKGTWMSYSSDFPGKEWELADKYFKSGMLDIDSLVEQITTLDQIPEIFNEINRGRIPEGKIIALL